MAFSHSNGLFRSKATGSTLKEEQPLRLLFNLFFYHFNRSEPSCIHNEILNLHLKFDMCAENPFRNVIPLRIKLLNIISCNALQQHFDHVSLETAYNAVRVINYTILRGCSSSSVQPVEIKTVYMVNVPR